ARGDRARALRLRGARRGRVGGPEHGRGERPRPRGGLAPARVAEPRRRLRALEPLRRRVARRDRGGGARARLRGGARVAGRGARRAGGVGESERQTDTLVTPALDRALAERGDEASEPWVVRVAYRSARVMGAVVAAASRSEVGRARAGELAGHLLGAGTASPP